MKTGQKILFLINSLEGGGAERVMSYLVNKLGREFEISLVLLDDRDIRYRVADHVEVIVLGAGNFLLASIRLGQLIRLNNFQLVLSFLNRSNYVNVLSNLVSPHITILSERNLTSKHFEKRKIYGFLNRQLVRLLYGFAHKVIAVSDGIKKDLVENYGLEEEKAIVFHNPCDVNAIISSGTEWTPEKPYICSVGRLAPQKRFDLLIRAYARSEVPLDLLVLGEGHEKDALSRLIKDLGLEDRVHLVGFQDNPYTFIRNAQFVVLSSDFEGFPNVIVESLALGKAVISTDCDSGPRDVLAPGTVGRIDSVYLGEFGILVPIGDEAGLAEAITKINSDTMLRGSFEKRGKIRALDFDLEKVAEMYKGELLDFLPLESEPPA